jgi:hypothetical protein
MKRLLLTGVATLFLATGTAHAGDALICGEKEGSCRPYKKPPPVIPEDMQGEWCADISYQTSPDEYLAGSCSDYKIAGIPINVTVSGYTQRSLKCAATEINPFDWYRKGSKNPWGPKYRIKFSCIENLDGRPYRSISKEIWWNAKGYLVIEKDRT